jgi:uncharacterized protein (TIGR02145 family)
MKPFALFLPILLSLFACDALIIEDGKEDSPSSSSAPASSSSATQGIWIIDTLKHEGFSYPMAKIGEQVWLAQNMKATPSVGESWCYGGHSSNCDLYGKLYDFEAASSVCPSGWHLPTHKDWNELLDFVNKSTGMDAAGLYLKANRLWLEKEGLDRFGFSALPGGFRTEGGDFTMLQERAYWWSEAKDAENAYFRSLQNDSDMLTSGYSAQGRGFSVRCVK